MCVCVGGDISYASVKQTTSTAGVLNCSVKGTEPSPQICAYFFPSITLPQGLSGAAVPASSAVQVKWMRMCLSAPSSIH